MDDDCDFMIMVDGRLQFFRLMSERMMRVLGQADNDTLAMWGIVRVCIFMPSLRLVA